MAMPQCCYLAKGAKRPSHSTNTLKFDRIRSLQFDQKGRPLSFRPEKFDLFTATQKFLPVGCIVAGLSSLFVVFFVTGLLV